MARIIPADASPDERRRINALEAMSSAAAVGFYTSEAFGRDSPEHAATCLPYETARSNYERVCAAIGKPAYATYDLD